MSKVQGVITKDTKKDISELINREAEKYGFDPAWFLTGLIAESWLTEKATRVNAWPDVSYGLSQPIVQWIQPDSGLTDLQRRGAEVLDTSENRRKVKEWAYKAENIIPYTAKRFRELLDRFKPNTPIEAWTRWNAPAWTLEENRRKQPESVRNYENAWIEAQKYRTGTEMARLPYEILWSPNRGGKRPTTMGIMIHTTRGGRNHSMAAEYSATVNWFLNRASSVSAHRVIAPHKMAIMVPDDDVAWHASQHNSTHLGIEICQSLYNTPIEDAQYHEAAIVSAAWCNQYGIPIRHVTDSSKWGIIGHEESAQGRAVGKSDPGRQFNWDYFINLINQYYTGTYIKPEPTKPEAKLELTPEINHEVRVNLDEWYYYAQVLDRVGKKAESEAMYRIINDVKRTFNIP